MSAQMNESNIQDTIRFMDEIRQQPGVLKDFIKLAYQETEQEKALEEILKDRKNPHIVLTGMGSSLYACYIVRNILQSKGIHVSVFESFELQMAAPDFFTADTVVIAVSQSGESLEVLELLEKLPKQVPIIGVTNYPNSRLYRNTKLSFGIYAGTEYLTSTKSYTNTLAAMLVLAYRLAGYGEEAHAELRSNMELCSQKMEELINDENLGKAVAGFISDINFLVCVGSNFSYVSASHSEVIAEEAGRFHASRFTPAQFVHGPIELIERGFGAVVYDFDRQYSDKCDVVRENILHYGGKVLLVTNRTDVQKQDNQLVCVIDHKDIATAVLLEIMPLELAIESLRKMRGDDAGHLTRVVKRIAK